jgi:hypothetical protein
MSQQTHRSTRERLGIWAVALLIFFGVVGAFIPTIIKQRQAAIQTQALDNLRQLGTALFAFDSEYGTFPDNNTAEDVKENTGISLEFSGPYSNDFFRQLIAEGLAQEQAFWCKTSFSPKQPDNIIDPPSRALSAGEVGFSYIMATQTTGQSSAGDPGRAVVIAPSHKARADWTFDPRPFQEKAFALNLDGSAGALPIGADFKLPERLLGTRYLQTPGDGTPWGSDATPVLRAPLPVSSRD